MTHTTSVVTASPISIPLAIARLSSHWVRLIVTSAAYRQAFVDACVKLLTDTERWQAISGRALATASGRSWPRIAEEWAS